MIVFLKDNDKVVCPSCKSIQSKPAKSFVVAGKIEKESRLKEWCEYCGKLIISERMPDGDIKISF